MRVLIVTSRDDAKKAGANMGTAHHKTSPDCRFWWPSCGHDTLRGQRFELVVYHHRPPLEDQSFILAHCTFPDTLVVHGDVAGPDLRKPLLAPTRFALFDRSSGRVVAQYSAEEMLVEGETVALPSFKLEVG